MRERLHAFALSLPEAWEDHPWDHVVAKVRKKVFAFLPDDAHEPRLVVKLPESAEAALGLDGAEPAGYGLGRSGWVWIPLSADVPVEVLEDWIEESYRAVAPRTLVKQLDSQAAAG